MHDLVCIEDERYGDELQIIGVKFSSLPRAHEIINKIQTLAAGNSSSSSGGDKRAVTEQEARCTSST